MRLPAAKLLPLFLILCALLLVVVGAFVPALRISALWSGGEPSSIVFAGLGALAGGSPVIGVLIVLFSLVFTVLKLVALALVTLESPWIGKQRAVALLELFGKWSMMDVFVIATLVGSIRLGVISNAEAKPGIYVFFAGILLSLILTARTAAALSVQRRLNVTPTPRQRVGVAVTSALALFFILVALVLPIAQLDKWVFGNTFHLVISSLEMLATGEFLLPAVLLVFVIVIPIVRLGALLFSQLGPDATGRLARCARRLGSWSMLDVYLLALAVVFFKLSDIVTVNLLVGGYALVGAAVLERTSHLLWMRSYAATPSE